MKSLDRRTGVILMICFTVGLVVNMMSIRGDFGRDFQSGSCLFWRLDCK